MTRISCVLFDLGGVIINWHNSWLIDEVSSKFALSKKKFTREFTNNLSALSSGKINETKFWINISKKMNCPELTTQGSLFKNTFRKYATVNESIITISKRLEENGLTLGILSNTEQSSYTIIKKLTSLDHFEFKFLSYEIGYTKPDSRIYQYVIDHIPFTREEIFFIDDRLPNIKSAQRLGIKSFKFSNYKELSKELCKQEILES